MRALVFSYYYPPASEVGAKRFAALVLRWVEQGNTTGVISAEEGAYKYLDTNLQSGGTVYRSSVRPLPSSSSYSGICRMLHRFWSRAMVGIDRQQGWIRSSVRAGLRAVQDISPQVIIATGPPFSAFVAGLRTANSSGLPLILDYRDPWTTLRTTRFPPPLGPSLGNKLERSCITRSSAIVCSTERLREQIHRKFNPHQSDIHVITNGFDLLPEYPDREPHNSFTILYAGSFYGERNLSPLITAVVKLRGKGTPVRIRVFGPAIPEEDINSFRNAGCLDSLVWEGVADYGLTLEEMQHADALYLPSGSDVNYALPFKLFDYLSAGKPVLAVSPSDSEVADFINKTGCGRCFDAIEQEEIAEFVVGLCEGKVLIEYDASDYRWDRLSKIYLDLIENVISRARDPE